MLNQNIHIIFLNISGTIPTEIGDLSSLQYMSMAYNALIGVYCSPGIISASYFEFILMLTAFLSHSRVYTNRDWCFEQPGAHESAR